MGRTRRPSTSPYARNEPAPQLTSMPAPQPTSMPAPQPTSMPAPQPTSMPAPQPTSMPAPQPTSMPAPQPDPTPTGTMGGLIGHSGQALENAGSVSEGPNQGTPTSIPSIHSILGENVSSKNKSKIINGEFIDLGILLDNSAGQDTAPKSLYLDVNGQLVAKDKNAKRINNIADWTDAFIIYTSIYSAAHPERVHELLKYIQTIRLGAGRCNGMGWRSYDEQFRLRRSQDPCSSWATVDTELWLIYLSPSISTTLNTERKQSPVGNLKCFDYNFKGLCTRPTCNYAHICTRCGGGHPKINCRSPGTMGMNNSFRPPNPRGLAQTGTSQTGIRPRFSNPTQNVRQPRYMGPRPFPN
ncbi:uncharacterized protein [Argopecten irradians]|uniref:uncharacterized protein isoform X1 n=1 Tax=Argopecten irradians TaxID=31199 RepID=UPI00371B83CE